MSDRLIRRIKLGGYAARAKIGMLPKEAVVGDINELYDENFRVYHAKFDAIRSALRTAPSYARGQIWRMALKLVRLVNDQKISDAKDEYEVYKMVLEKAGVAEYLDKALEAAGVLGEITGGTEGGGAGGGGTTPVL